MIPMRGLLQSWKSKKLIDFYNSAYAGKDKEFKKTS